MSISFIDSASAFAPDPYTATTPPIDTTGADFLVAHVLHKGFGGALTVSDSKGNTWIPLTEQQSNDFFGVLYYCIPTSVGSGHTFSAHKNLGDPAIAVAAFSGVRQTSPFDQEDGAANNNDTSSLAPGSITPTEDNCLVVTGMSGGATFVSLGESYAEEHLDDTESVGIGWKIQTAADATNPTWSISGTARMAVEIASFFAEGGGGGEPAYRAGSVKVMSRRVRHRHRGR